MVPPPCLTVGTVFLDLKAPLLLLPTYLLSQSPNGSVFVSFAQKYFLQMTSPAELKGFVLGEGTSFLAGSLSVHSDVKLAPLRTKTLIFQLFFFFN